MEKFMKNTFESFSFKFFFTITSENEMNKITWNFYRVSKQVKFKYIIIVELLEVCYLFFI